MAFAVVVVTSDAQRKHPPFRLPSPLISRHFHGGVGFGNLTVRLPPPRHILGEWLPKLLSSVAPTSSAPSALARFGSSATNYQNNSYTLALISRDAYLVYFTIIRGGYWHPTSWGLGSSGFPSPRMQGYNNRP
jgi:hypothetical protein